MTVTLYHLSVFFLLKSSGKLLQIHLSLFIITCMLSISHLIHQLVVQLLSAYKPQVIPSMSS